MNEPKAGEIYRHFKSTPKKEMTYRIVAVALDCENPSQKLVIYEQLYEGEEFPSGTIWKRSLEDFCGDKIFEDGKKVKRFTLIE